MPSIFNNTNTSEILNINVTATASQYLENNTKNNFLEIDSEKSASQLAFVILLGAVVVIALTILFIGIIKEDKRVQDWVNWVREKKQGF
jgi:hypothetical protein